MSSEFVPEYKLGLFAYESLYKADSSDYHADNKYRITPGLAKDADKTSTADPTQVLDDTGETVYDFFDDMGIGSIPFGAAVALLDHANDIKDFNNATVNDGNNAFYPRNVLFNKYFNKRNICVITPNAIMSNANSTNAATAAAAATAGDTVVGGTVTSQDYDGAYSSDYGALPGFSVDTTNILPQFANNVLTDETGNIVLAVRAMSSGYQGIHFIVVQRSGLSLYGSKLDETTNQYVDLDSAEEDPSVATLSEYWTTYTPTSGNYPTYTDDEGNKANKTTYVNLNKQLTSDISARASGLAGVIKSYNSNLDTYHFEWLVENNKVTFADEQLEADMKSYCSTKRSNTVDSAFDTWKDNWKSYAEALEVQEQSRDITWEAADGRGTTGNGDGLGWLLPESVVAGFNDPSVRENNALWEKGGACYYED
nr:hypothetical protein [Bacilli bacterium]